MCTRAIEIRLKSVLYEGNEILMRENQEIYQRNGWLVIEHYKNSVVVVVVNGSIAIEVNVQYCCVVLGRAFTSQLSH